MTVHQRFKMTLGACCLGLMVGLYGGTTGSALAHTGTRAAVKATVVNVIAGKPSELAFKVTNFSNLAAGTITFKVKDEGVAFHDFKICTSPVKNTAHNSCVGIQTKILHPGQTATLTVKLTKKGLYEYLCSVPGHAAAGMKGLIGIGLKVTVPKVVTTTPVTTAPATTTTATPPPPPPTTTTAGTTTASTGSGGNYGCPAGETVMQASPVGDTDADNQGGADDGDGCI